MPSSETLTAIIYGRVQGVNFRHHTAVQARALGLTGWVRNREDGTVETIAMGERAALERFLVWLHQGSPAAQVTHVAVTWTAAAGAFERFEIRAD